ncbi:MAG: DUF115 domain-containing protein, partial [Anaerolineales bacterium]|nr:DUF115 domain-containing protein [Anaerolineales bacterium]
MNKSALKRILPAPLWKAGSDTYWWWYNRGRHITARTFSPRWRQSQRMLQRYHNSHTGKRCFVIGNGPSLRNTDLSKLKGEFTFGLNRIYMLFPELGFPTTCLVSVNDLVLEQCAEEMKALNFPKFITWRARRWLGSDPQTIFLDTDYTGVENFRGDASRRMFEGFTVTYVALQLAYYMGFQEAILVGVDHNFQTKGPANQA